jgi:hypothetical protein
MGNDMRNRRSSGFGGPDRDGLSTRYARDLQPRQWESDIANSNSTEEVFGEVGLVLVIVLGIVLAINMVLVALHIS